MFAKAAIKRFNEFVSCAPPPTQYDPKLPKSKYGVFKYREEKPPAQSLQTPSALNRSRSASSLGRSARSHSSSRVQRDGDGFVTPTPLPVRRPDFEAKYREVCQTLEDRNEEIVHLRDSLNRIRKDYAAQVAALEATIVKSDSSFEERMEALRASIQATFDSLLKEEQAKSDAEVKAARSQLEASELEFSYARAKWEQYEEYVEQELARISAENEPNSSGASPVLAVHSKERELVESLQAQIGDLTSKLSDSESSRKSAVEALKTQAQDSLNTEKGLRTQLNSFLEGLAELSLSVGTKAANDTNGLSLSDAVQSVLMTVMSKVSRLEKDLEIATEKVDILEKERNDFQMKLASHEGLIIRASNLACCLETESLVSEKNLRELEEKYDSQKNENEELVKCINALTEEKLALLGDLEQLQHETGGTKTLACSLVVTIKELTRRADNITAAHRSEQESQAKQIAEINLAKVELESKLSVAEDEITNNRLDAEEAKRELLESQTLQGDLQQKVALMSAELYAVKDDLPKLQSELTYSKAELDKARSVVEDAKSKASSAELQIQILQDEAQIAAEKASIILEESKKMALQVAELGQLEKTRKTENDSLVIAKENLEAELNVKVKKVRDLDDQVQNLQIELEAASVQSKIYIEEKAELELALESKTNFAQELLEKVKGLNEKVETMEKEKEFIQGIFKDSEQEKTDLIEGLKKEKVELTNQVERLEAQLSCEQEIHENALGERDVQIEDREIQLELAKEKAKSLENSLHDAIESLGKLKEQTSETEFIFETRLKNLMVEKDAAENSLAEVTKKHSFLDEELKITKRLNQEFETALNEKKAEVGFTKKELDEVTREKDCLFLELQAKVEEVARLDSQVESLGSQKLKTEETVTALQQEINFLIDESEKQAESIDAFTEEVASLKAENLELNQEVAKLKEILTTLNGSIKILRSQLEESESEKSEWIENDQAQEKKMTDLRSENTALKKNIEGLKEQLASFEQETNGLSSDLSVLQSRLVEKDQAFSHADLQRIQAEANVLSLQNELSLVSGAKETLSETVKETTKALESKIVRAAELEKQVCELVQTVDKAVIEADMLRGQLVGYAAREESLSLDLAEVCRRLNLSEANVTELTDKLLNQEASFMTERTRIEQRVRELEHQAEELKSEKHIIEQEVSSVRGELAMTQTAMNRTLCELEEDRSYRERTVQELDRVKVAFDLQTEKHKKESEKRESQLQNLMEENQELRNTISRKVTELESHKSTLGATVAQLGDVKTALESETTLRLKQATEYEQEKHKLENHIAISHVTLAEREEQMNSLLHEHQEKTDSLMKEVTEMKDFFEDIKKDCVQLESERNEHVHRTKVLVGDMNELQEKYNLVKSENDALKEEVKAVAKKGGEEVARLTGDFEERLKRLNDEHEVHKLQCETQIDYLKVQVENGKDQLSDLQSRLSVSQSQMKKFMADLRKREEDIKTLNRSLAEKESAEETLRRQTEFLATRVHEEQEKIKSLLAVQKQSETQIEKLEAHARLVVAEQSKVRQLTLKLQEVEAKHKEQFEMMKKQWEERVEKETKARKSLDAELQQLDSLKKELAEMTARHEELLKKIDPFMALINGFEAERRALMEINHTTESDLHSLASKYTDLIGHQNNKQKIKHLEKLKLDLFNKNKELQTARVELEKEKQHRRLAEERASDLSRKLQQGQRSQPTSVR